MKLELEARLYEAFPNLYADKDKSMRETCMCWGFECGDGWFDLLWRLSTKLEALILKEDKPENFRASQVKEKYGTLRFYMTSQTEAMDEEIRQAEEESATTCMRCGKAGLCNDSGWITCLCEGCRGGN